MPLSITLNTLLVTPPCHLTSLDSHRGRTPDAEMVALDKMAEVASDVQDDFDLQEGQMAEVELQDRDENLVGDLRYSHLRL